MALFFDVMPSIGEVLKMAFTSLYWMRALPADRLVVGVPFIL